MTVFRQWPGLSDLKPTPAPEDTTAARAETIIRALNKARGQEPPEPPTNPGAAAIVAALKKARGQK